MPEVPETFTFFWSGPFSQWYRSDFVANDFGRERQRYTHAEQYMMAGKAYLFGDNKTLDKILKAKTPREQKALGREIEPFDPEIWDQHCLLIVYRGNFYKFSQNPELRIKLLATAGTTLVEASPEDRIWGIGYAADHPAAQDRKLWKGKNYLGRVETQVREDLIVGTSQMEATFETLRIAA